MWALELSVRKRLQRLGELHALRGHPLNVSYRIRGVDYNYAEAIAEYERSYRATVAELRGEERNKLMGNHWHPRGRD